jgi:hypothetical protein
MLNGCCYKTVDSTAQASQNSFPGLSCSVGRKYFSNIFLLNSIKTPAPFIVWTPWSMKIFTLYS